MFELFTKPALTRKQRFSKALAVGITTALVGLVVRIVLALVYRIDFALLYALIAYLIALAIQKFGRGVQVQFSILAAGLAFAVILIGDLVVYTNFGQFVAMLSSVFNVAVRIISVYIAFYFARIV